LCRGGCRHNNSESIIFVGDWRDNESSPIARKWSTDPTTDDASGKLYVCCFGKKEYDNEENNNYFFKDMDFVWIKNNYIIQQKMEKWLLMVWTKNKYIM